ncbi:MAG: hypothetical protein Ct9H300mP31_07580 [Acidimicrobiaceae bacterium]|nr:MAG: hypothetical protein Ct9H300mP31_07580 [Acidimicrobiaceae bacterium]
MALDDFGGWPGLLARLCDGENLSADEAEAVLTEILGGEAEPAQIAGFLVGLKVKGEDGRGDDRPGPGHGGGR